MSTEDATVLSRIEGILAAEDGDAAPEDEETSTQQELTATDSGSQPDEEDENAVEAEADDEAEAEAETDDTEEDDDTEEVEPAGAVIEIELDGQTRRLTADEVKAGFLRESDYSRKMHEVGNARHELEAERSKFEAQRQQAYQKFEQELAALTALQEPEPDWKAIRAEDPLGYIDRKAEWDEKQAARSKVIAEANRRNAVQQQQAQAQRQQYLQAQRQQLPDLIPEWRDAAVMQKETAELAAFLKADGFDPQDVDNISDAKLVRLARDAKRYRDSLKSTAKKEVVKKKTAAKPKVVKPGTPPKVNQQKSADRSALDKARRTQRPQDWTNVFERFV